MTAPPASSARTSGTGKSPHWTTVDELVAKLRTRWQKGTYLCDHAHGVLFEPFSLPVRAPTAAEFAGHFDAVQQWADQFDTDNRTGTARQRFTVERRSRRSLTFGDNPVAVRVHVESLDQLCAILGTATDVECLDDVLRLTRDHDLPPGARDVIADWVADHPHAGIEHRQDWPSLLKVIAWIIEHDRGTLDLRHLDVPGIDTKFVERNRKIVSRLLEAVLPPEQIDRTAKTFAGRFGFRPRPGRVRLRLLSPVPELPEVLTEAELRIDELAQLPLSVATVFVVENLATFLAFPAVPDAIVVFGEGYGVTLLEGVPWLAERKLVYWGDLDTHGFAILDRLRQRVPGLRSLLMDRSTLLAHQDAFVVEKQPTAERLEALTADEQALYRDLVEDRYGHAVRLEQERIRFSIVRQALDPWLRAERNC